MRYLIPSLYLAPNNFVFDVFNPKTLTLPQLLASQKFIVELKTVKHPTTMEARIALGKGVVPGPESILSAFEHFGFSSFIYLLTFLIRNTSKPCHV